MPDPDITTATGIIQDCMRQTISASTSDMTIQEIQDELAKVGAQAVNRINNLKGSQ